MSIFEWKSSARSELLGPRAHVAQRGLRRLLHHVAELAGERQLALAGHQRRFGDEHLAADFGPGQAGGDADLVLLLGHARAEARHAEVLGDLLAGDRLP